MTNLPTTEEADRALAATMRELASFSRMPFRKVLAELLGAAPTPEAIAAFAAKYPDKWAAAVSIFSGLAGFEKGLVALNVYNVGAMSDVQLLAEIAAGDEGLAKLGLKRAPVTIDQPPAPAEGVSPAADPVAAGGNLEPPRQSVGTCSELPTDCHSAGCPADVPKKIGTNSYSAQENRREAPRPAAERGPDGGYVDPTEAV